MIKVNSFNVLEDILSDLKTNVIKYKIFISKTSPYADFGFGNDVTLNKSSDKIVSILIVSEIGSFLFKSDNVSEPVFENFNLGIFEYEALINVERISSKTINAEIS